MLTRDQRDRIEIVLVSPRNPLNIGAVARAMANFGFGRLTVVSAYEPHWREARSAVGAPGLLQSAREVGSLAEAVAQSTLVIGTGTRTYRKPEQDVVLLPELPPRIADELARTGRISIVFGPEKHGLTREDLALCHLFVEIPTDPVQPSMNLGQAVAVCLYEIATRSLAELASNGSAAAEAAPDPESLPAVSGDLEILAGLIEQVMVASNYSPRSMQQANRHSLRVLLRRLNWRAPDLRRALGLFRRTLWSLGKERKRNVTK